MAWEVLFYGEFSSARAIRKGTYGALPLLCSYFAHIRALTQCN